MRAALAAVALLVSGTVAAHHAWTEVDTGKSLTLTGVVESLHWENPHSSLKLAVNDGGRDVVWTVEMSGIARMESRGLSADVLAKGRTLTIVASPSRTEAHTVRANRIRSDGKDYGLY
jgi:Family of unknown function (DUF6152)